MQNDVLDRVVERSLAGRRAASEGEVRRLVDAGVAVMRRTGSIDPRVADVVAEAGLSNQAFYRHFRSKDELLLAIMAEGRRTLLEYLERQTAPHDDPADRVRRWIEGVLAQATHRRAAESTRPFAIHAARLMHQFPEETAASAEALRAPLVEALTDLDSPDPERDADAVYQLAVGRMERHLALGTTPTAGEVEHLVHFCVCALDPAAPAPVRTHGASGAG